MGSGRPNVVFVVVDDLRHKSGQYGERVHTPNIDHLMKSGISFENAHTSFAACAPSRVSVFTGRRNDNIRIWGFQPLFRQRNPQKKTLPGAFRESGYRTVALGKIMDARVFELEDGQQGPDDCVPDLEAACSWDKILTSKVIRENGVELCGTLVSRYPGLGADQAKKSILVHPISSEEEGSLLEACLTTVAIDELRSLRQSQQPFFLAVGWVLPHVPWVAPQRLFDLYTQEYESEDKESIDQFWAKQSSDASKYTNSEIEAYPDAGAVNTSTRVNAYMASATFVDEQVGKFMSVVNESLQDNDIIVFWSDHGFQFGEHGMWGKWTLFEHATKVPLSITVPIALQQFRLSSQILPGTTTRTPVDSIDIMPTLLDLCNITVVPPSRLSGTSLVPLMQDPDSFVRAAAVSQMVNYNARRGRSMGYAIRTVRYRLIVYTEDYPFEKLGTVGRENDLPMKDIRIGLSELYDYYADGAEEKINRFGHPKYLQVQRKLMALVRRVTDRHWTSLIGVQPFDHVDELNNESTLPTISPSNQNSGNTTSVPSLPPISTTMKTAAPTFVPSFTMPSAEERLNRFETFFGVPFLSNDTDTNVSLVMQIPSFLNDIGVNTGHWHSVTQRMELATSLACSSNNRLAMKATLSEQLWGQATDHVHVSCLSSAFAVSIQLLASDAPTASPTISEGPPGIAAYVAPLLLVFAFVLLTVLCLRLGHRGNRRSVTHRSKATKETQEEVETEVKEPHEGIVSEGDLPGIDAALAEA